MKPVFPYNLSSLYNDKDYSAIKGTPWGNSITKDLALECLKNEALGKDNICDMLCISFASTDIIGHAYGLRAVETEDVYLRLDKDIEEILNTLDAEVGKDNYTVFLTADHGAADVPYYLRDMKIPAGLVNGKKIEKELRAFCKKLYGDSLILSVLNQQVFLNEEKVYGMKMSLQEVEQALASYLLKLEGIAEAYPSSAIKYQAYGSDNARALIAAGYNFKRSGNVAFTYLPAWMDNAEKGTTHGAAYGYDTHVPLIFFGAGINKGESVKKVYITDIAPTVSILLNMAFPSGCISQPIEAALSK
jgi:arylsulfatase A-like enzyme